MITTSGVRRRQALLVALPVLAVPAICCRIRITLFIAGKPVISVNDAEALTTTIGILRFQKDKGRLPQSIDELAASGYIRLVQIDPSSGVPLVYRPMESSFRPYSLGRDSDDDGRMSSRLSARSDPGDLVCRPRGEHTK